ncbi:hypothetical protein SAHY_05473 [Salinisphaera hydrothermalis EPR70]
MRLDWLQYHETSIALGTEILMNKTNTQSRSRWLTRLSAPLAGLALLATGIGVAQAHDFDHYRHHDRDDMHRTFHRNHDGYRDHDRRDYRHYRYDRDHHYGWRSERHDHRRYGDDHRYDHRYARDGWHHDDDDRGVFGRW